MNEPMLPPHDREAEQAVLGSCLIDPEAIFDVDELSPSDFYIHTNAAIFAAMRRLVANGEPIDALLVQDEVEATVREDAGFLSYLIDLTNNCPTSLHAAYYGKIVSELATRRRIINAGQRLANLAYDTDTQLSDVVSQAMVVTSDALSGKDNGRMVGIDTAVSDAVNKIEARARGDFGDCINLPWAVMRGVRLEQGEVLTIAARPAMGKTAFWLQTGIAQARAGRRVIMFSLEMSAEQLMTRVLAQAACVPMETLKNGELNEAQWQDVYRAQAELSTLPLQIYDGGAGINTVLNEVTRDVSRYGRGAVVMVDYIGLLEAEGFRAGDTYAAATHVSKRMKRLARDYDCYIINNSQLSRAVESRQDKRPMLSDLRDTGAVEQDSDIVMFLYRDEYYNPDTTEWPGVAEVLVRKYRNGRVGTYQLAWIGERTMFGDLALREVSL